MIGWKKRLLRAFFPRRCIYCDGVTHPDASYCERCAPFVPRMQEPFCYRCGRTKSLCTCKGHRRRYDRCVVAMRYEEGAKRAVLRLKYSDDADLVETMAQEMVAAARARMDAASLDVVTFIPMRKAELRSRGYNQSELLAKEVARELALPCRPLLTKLYDTSSQKSLSMVQRRGNLLGVFDVIEDVVGERVLLVDDVMTTGATFDECAKMLKICGAQSVTALAFAATVLHDGDSDEE